MRKICVLVFGLTLLVLSSRPARALPIFARKYHTSCVTCHTVFPKLTPFGEAFRRNGYRFPGVDSDNIKAEQIPLATDAAKAMFPDSVWPASISPFPPLALGFNGQAIFHPDKNSSGGAADNHSGYNSDTLIEEAHLWTAGSVDDSISYYSEVTFSGGGTDVERAALYFGDLVGPAHAVNAVVGRFPAMLTSFGPHSSYIADAELPAVPATGLYGATSDPFDFTDNHNGIEVNGVVGGRVDYAAGLVSGTNIDTRTSANFYGHIGYKLGGATLDGEGGGKTDIDSEHSVTLDAFAYRSSSRFTDAAMAPTKNTALVIGAALRAQWENLELNSGLYTESDDHVTSTAPSTTLLDHFDELSYTVYPWLAVALRADYTQLTPSGGATVSNLKITPGVVALVRPNIRFILTMPIESANGAPDGGWGAAGLAAAPADATSKVGPEIEAAQVTLWAAF